MGRASGFAFLLLDGAAHYPFLNFIPVRLIAISFKPDPSLQGNRKTKSDVNLNAWSTGNRNADVGRSPGCDPRVLGRRLLAGCRG
jgi:hypothetical protein